MAIDRGLRVLTTLPADDDAGVPFAGLHALLRPILSHLDDLHATPASELRVAFELAPGTPAEPFRIAFAVLALLEQAAAADPVVVIADDVHRLDRCTADALCIVARWLRPDDAVVVLLTGRAARSSRLVDSGLEQLTLGTFSAPASRPRSDARPPRYPAPSRPRAARCGAGRFVR
jgi:hypothetical protein